MHYHAERGNESKDRGKSHREQAVNLDIKIKDLSRQLAFPTTLGISQTAKKYYLI
ncbi:MAG: hypothetical protein ACJAT7_003409 [Psychromonas sp.]|jgi:hypothetical protein